MKRIAVGLVAFVALSVGACRLLLPERFAVNAPVLHMMLGRGIDSPSDSEVNGRLRAPEGFSIQLYARDISNARFLHPTAGGGLLVTRPRSGEVLLLEPDANGDGRADGRRVLLSGLNRPHGIEVHDGWLYIGEGDGVGRIPFDSSANATSGEYTRIVDGLPEGGNHWTRTVRIGPDGYLYVSVGSSCNVCEDAPRRAAMLRFRADGSDETLYATGLRNSVGFDWRPGTDELYATDNGRDLLGDDYPPCELNRIVEGGFYGWPYLTGNNRPDPDFGDRKPNLVARAIPPVHAFRAHNAPLGITFVRGDSAPASYRGAALVALHGSWNRTEKDGYKVVSLHWGADGEIRERDFLWGFELDDDVIGRPVDVVEGADGAFYVSDDYGGAVFRVAFADAPAASGPAPRVAPVPAADPLAGLSQAERAAADARGRALFERFDCATCHDPERASDGLITVELLDLPSRYDIDSLMTYLETPNPPMPAFPLDAQQRRDLAIHLLGR